jgi:hypothetical protein
MELAEIECSFVPFIEIAFIKRPPATYTKISILHLTAGSIYNKIPKFKTANQFP